MTRDAPLLKSSTGTGRFFLLTLIMVIVAVVIGGVSILILYNTSVEQQRVRLIEAVQTNGRLIESILAHERIESPGKAIPHATSIVTKALSNLKTNSETSEFTMAKRGTAQIIFLLRYGQSGTEHPEPIYWYSDRAEPMRRALQGKSGSMIGLDHRGNVVLAAYESVDNMALGLVSKIDLTELRKPVIAAATAVVLIGALVIGIGAWVFYLISEPMIREIEERKYRYERMTTLTAEGVVIHDGKLIVDINKAFSTMFGYEENELIGKGFDELLTVDSLMIVQHHVQDKATAPYEVIGLHKDGAEFPIEISGSDVTYHGVDYRVASVRDLTAYNENLRALHDSEDKFKLVADAVPVLLAYVDAEQKFQFSNKAYKDWFGQSSFEILGRTVKSVIGAKIYETHRPYIEHALSGTRVTFESAGKDRLGNVRNMLALLVPHTLPSGRVAGYYSLTSDITQSKIAAAEKAALELELLNASKMEAIGQLAGGIAHEVNTPTQYIGDNLLFLKNSFADLLPILAEYANLTTMLKEKGDFQAEVASLEEAVEHADLDYVLDEFPSAIQEAIDGNAQVARIVLAMKEFSHPGSKEKEPVDLNKAIKTTATVSRNEWKYVAELETDLDPEMPPVLCLPGELNQVFLNMIVNGAHALAAKANEDEKGLIKISTRVDGEMAEIRISDNGTGIPLEARDKVFEPFFTTKGVGKGTGQGLTIAYNIITQKHSGNISFETEDGVGTTFLIQLPINDLLDEQDEDTQA